MTNELPKLEHTNRNVFTIRVPTVERKDWEQWVLLTSDRHWDNPKSNHELQIKHLEEAKKRNALVLDFGDFFCAMQGKYDKRSNKKDLRPEHQTDSYLDSLVDTASNFFAPYARNLAIIGSGNHEAAIQKNHETNLIERLVGVLNHVSGSNIAHGGFSGWVRLQFRRDTDSKKTLGSTVLHYDHGYGGGGPVTKDMIQHQRRSVYLPDADIIVSGHTHDSWVTETARVRLTPSGTVIHDVQTHIKLPTYKDDYGDGFGGWAVNKGFPPKPIGAYWLRFFFKPDPARVLHTVIKAEN